VLSNCPDCNASLAVLRIIPGRAGVEYWTMRCPRCGGIHLDIVNPSRSLAME
jgi:Zn-finger nucleic acid-binding protein